MRARGEFSSPRLIGGAMTHVLQLTTIGLVFMFLGAIVIGVL